MGEPPAKSFGRVSLCYTIVSVLYCSCLFQSLVQALEWENPTLNRLVEYLSAAFDEHVFMTKNMSAIIWGEVDPLLKTAGALAPKWFYQDFFGYFMNVSLQTHV